MVTLQNANDASSQLVLQPATLLENAPADSLAGTLTTSDQDLGDSHRYTLVAATRDSDNARFRIDGNRVLSQPPLDDEASSQYQVRIETRDQAGATLVQTFVIVLGNANDSPVLAAMLSLVVQPNRPCTTTLHATDQDLGDRLVFSTDGLPGCTSRIKVIEQRFSVGCLMAS